MTPNEVVEFFVANLKSVSGGVDTHQLAKGMVRPAGIRAGSIHEGKLLLMVYTGTREYYFEKHKQDVEMIFSSVELVK